MVILIDILEKLLIEHCPKVVFSRYHNGFKVIIKTEDSPRFWFLFSTEIYNHIVIIGPEYGRSIADWNGLSGSKVELDIRDPNFFDEFINIFDRLHTAFGPPPCLASQ